VTAATRKRDRSGVRAVPSVRCERPSNPLGTTTAQDQSARPLPWRIEAGGQRRLKPLPSADETIHAYDPARLYHHGDGHALDRQALVSHTAQAQANRQPSIDRKQRALLGESPRRFRCTRRYRAPCSDRCAQVFRVRVRYRVQSVGNLTSLLYASAAWPCTLLMC
jgi:hypothetical protein